LSITSFPTDLQARYGAGDTSATLNPLNDEIITLAKGKTSPYL
jgi:hypothetical protein